MRAVMSIKFVFASDIEDKLECRADKPATVPFARWRVLIKVNEGPFCHVLDDVAFRHSLG